MADLYVCVLGSVQELGVSLEDVCTVPLVVPAKSLGSSLVL